MKAADKHEGLLGLPNQDPKLKLLAADHIIQPFSAVKVKNTVTWINPDINSGLDGFTLGEPTDLACQIALGSSRRDPDRIVWARPLHNRTVIVSAGANITIGGQVFKYLDAKGTGNLKVMERNIIDPNENRYREYMVAKNSKPDSEDREKTWGQATQSWVDIDTSMSKRLQQLGIRTIPLVAVASISEIMGPKGDKMSLVEARESGYLAQGTEPVILFRAWVTPFRLAEACYTPEQYKKWDDVYTTKDVEKIRVIVRTAIEDIRSDTSIPLEVRDSFSDIDQYLRWLASSIGSNLGRMHQLGITHGYLRALHNITLDGRIVDLDSMEENSSLERIYEEADALFNPRKSYFTDFLSGIPKLFSLDINPMELLKITKDAYYDSLESTRLKVMRGEI